MYVINTIVYSSLTNLLFHFKKLTNGAKVNSFLTNIESVYFLLFLITKVSIIFGNKETLIKFLQHYILFCYFRNSKAEKLY